MGRKIPMWQAACVMLFAVLMLMYAVGLLEMLFGDAWHCANPDLHVPLVIAAVAAAIVGKLNGYKWEYMEQAVVNTISRTMGAILILLIVGMLIGSWLAAGIIPAMIYYGLSMLSPGIFLFAACLICGIVALSTGTSWGTAGTLGVAFIGIARGLGIPEPMAAGAIISGGYFGDKMSPMSDTTNLAPAVAGTTLFEHVRHQLWTAVPALVIALIGYLVIGFATHGSGTADLDSISALREGIAASFNVNPVLLLAPLLVIVVIALKIPALPGLSAGVALGIAFGVVFQGVAIGDLTDILHYGYAYEANEAMVALGGAAEQAQYDLEYLLEHEAMEGMLWTVSLILCAMVFGGIMDGTGMLASIASGLLKAAKNTGALVLVTVCSCFVVNLLAADQYLAIILPGKMYREAFEDRKLDGKNLSRCLEGSGTVTSPLIPWNSCGATMSSFLGVSSGQYFRFAFFNLVTPLINIIYGYTNFTMVKMTDERYEKILKQREESRKEELAALEG
ncbi:MAG: Na+/H+ antiporter NhaC [Clostridiales bacterium]|nr:Na+/H+ antiporter NhaC [Clostridiales bacterium]